MEQYQQAWGPVLLGAALLFLVWGVVGRKRAKTPSMPARPEGTSERAAAPQKPAAAKERPAPAKEHPVVAAAKERSAASKEPSAPDATKTASVPPKKPARRTTALVWEVPQVGQADDEDITVLRAIPVFDDQADVTIEGQPPAEPGESEPEEDRVSRVEMSYEEGAEPDEMTGSSARILLYAGGDSDQGRVRPRNEDSLLMMPERSLFAIADGMGGHRGGEIASSIAIDTLRDAFFRSTFDARLHVENDVPRRAKELATAVQMSNECVRSMAMADRELSDMGTTLVAARFSPNKQRLYIGHVGDSRCYRLRRGVFRQLTTDHTMASLGMKGPRSKDLYQAVGVSPDLTIDMIVDKPQDDDVYLLCSDGLSKMMSDDEVRDVLVEHQDLESALYTLIEIANDRGGKDNVTVIIVKVLAHNSKKIEILAELGAKNASGAS
ncbi:MAG TPA: protein phosphatase 2C domain-containing protein [Polyangiaceae bacterium]|nr:protein phosphatase 2C domain-containing protein [Polyangiaceae bacterium]